MEVIFIAQLDEQNHVIGVSQLNRKGFVPAAHLIELTDFDTSVLGKVYDIDKKTFSKPTQHGGEM